MLSDEIFNEIFFTFSTFSPNAVITSSAHTTEYLIEASQPESVRARDFIKLLRVQCNCDDDDCVFGFFLYT